MKVAILGYGKMGHMVEKVLVERGHEVVTIIDNEENWKSNAEAFARAEVAIDFSEPKAALPNMVRAFDMHVPMVVGTTGWLDRLEEVRKRCMDANGKLVYSANFSIGVNIFFKINKMLAQLMNSQDRYRVSMEETHHIHKKDAPSGTAIWRKISSMKWMPSRSGSSPRATTPAWCFPLPPSAKAKCLVLTRLCGPLLKTPSRSPTPPTVAKASPSVPSSPPNGWYCNRPAFTPLKM